MDFLTDSGGARPLQVSRFKVSAQATLVATTKPVKSIGKTSRFIFIIVESPLSCFLSDCSCGALPAWVLHPGWQALSYANIGLEQIPILKKYGSPFLMDVGVSRWSKARHVPGP
ncbi:hypothetical protein [Verminephrobacter eiseniae]|uniref:hypothetical protein n=1 Tax=Verminephrobacter eiseniae TaxID=364317 RepID=UPI002237EEAC|nr:hypothetical protein [Verminephrobacter eiseniae]